MAVNTENPGFCRSRLEELLKKRFFYCPSYEIYGGIGSFWFVYYGPPGMALEQNILNVWRKHFVYEENMLEIGTSIVTPHEVLETSGHVSKFRDWMCKDPSTGEVFRADHIIKEILLSRIKKRVESGLEGEKVEGGASGTKFDTLDESLSRIREYEDIISRIDGYDGEGLSRVIEEYDIRNPATNVRMEGPVGFNLMFATEIGPKGNMTGYLRPETAQGQFLNFNKLLEFNNGKMPFASVVVGKSFRNEISPRSGLLRMREFTMAEIEHYVDPLNKDHRRFNEVENVKMKFLTREIQMSGKEEVIEMKIGEAVARGILENTTLAYFLARIHLFLIRIGMNQEKLRFRQHMNNEMAHYASVCWDAELLTSYGWIECVGCADRAAYDLTVHSEKTKEKLVVRELLPKPMEVTEWVVNVDKKKIENLKFPSSLFTIEQVKKTISVREYIPNVIEPSFGIGRILYSLIEHSYWIRSDDVDRCVLSFPPIVAPVKCLLVPLSNNSAFDPIIDKLSFELRQLGISHKVDDSSAAIGRRYSRNDELGTPFGITVDFQTVNDGSLTLRERDTTRQIRASEKEILRVIKELSEGLISWDDVLKDFPIFNKQITDIPEITDLYIRE
uniref:glycine--tRNA ligase n=1 Tax=Pneumocystis carinii TaxID=4754 RepID=Q9HEX0_PNECA|nr:glycyl tRNA synthetase [Pneumocystis carinii]